MNSNRNRCPNWLMSLYRLCLRIYPASFREEFAVAMEQAFADRYVDFMRNKKTGTNLQFAFSMLRDTGESVCRQHWQSAESAGFTRLRFLVLLALLAPVLIFHESVIRNTVDGMVYAKNFNLEFIRAEALSKEYEVYRTELALELRKSSDPITIQAANLLERNNNWAIESYPSGEALREMNVRIARAVVAEPLQYSWFAKFDRVSSSEAANLNSMLWSIENFPELKRCNDIGKLKGKDVSCNATWAWMLHNRKYEEIMLYDNYVQPSSKEILHALENNRYTQLQNQYIAINKLDACNFADERRFYNNIICPERK
jgi:hypothetical protein